MSQYTLFKEQLSGLLAQAVREPRSESVAAGHASLHTYA